MPFRKNSTIDNLGQLNLTLADYFSFPDNFQKLFNDHDIELNYIFKIGLLRQ